MKVFEKRGAGAKSNDCMAAYGLSPQLSACLRVVRGGEANLTFLDIQEVIFWWWW